MTHLLAPENRSWHPPVYYVETAVKCPLDKAWLAMLDYEAWNPSFAGSELEPVHGDRREEGGIILIRKSHKDANGTPVPEFLCETVRIIPQRSIVWYVYAKDAEQFRNFVEFSLAETPTGVIFKIHYYAQDSIPLNARAQRRAMAHADFEFLSQCFKKYCESQ